MRTIPLCAGALLLVALPAVASTRPAEAAAPDGDHTTFKAVVAEGTGCPAGTSNTSLSGDGLVFTTTFSAYEANIDSGEQTSSRECRLTVKVHTPPGRSVTLQSFAASGYAYLEEGVRAIYQATYAFGGRPVAPTSAPRTPFVGPHDADFVSRDDMPVGDTAWTPCGTDHELVITTSLSLHSDNGKGSGYINMAAFDGSAEAESRVQERTCTPGGVRAPGDRGGDGAGAPRQTGPAVAVRVQPRFTG
jgi:hypothetical protein